MTNHKVIEITQAERGFLMLAPIDNPEEELQFRIARNYHKETLTEDDFVISQTIINLVIQTNEAVLLSNIPENLELKSVDSIKKLELKSALGVPLYSASHLFGVIYVDNSMKDIASLLYITPRSVDQRRHQIRQKLHLTSDQNLTSFLLSF